MLGNIITSTFNMIWSKLKLPLLIAIVLIIILLIIYFGNVLYYKLIKGCKTSGELHYAVKKESIFKVLWYGISKAAHDRCTRNIEFIPESWTGLICVEGMPGTGKSTSAVWDTILKQTEYPKLKVYTNMDVVFQNGSIDTWKDLMRYNNDEYGQIYILDELSSILNSRSWKDFPVEALDLITQSRKVRTRILYTTQDFQMTDINLRRLTKEVWKPITFLRTICFILKYQPKVNSEGKVEKMKFKGIEFYRQDDNLRNSFDTRKQIGKIKREGFAPRESQIRADNTNRTTIEINNKKRR